MEKQESSAAADRTVQLPVQGYAVPATLHDKSLHLRTYCKSFNELFQYTFTENDITEADRVVLDTASVLSMLSSSVCRESYCTD